MTTIPAALRLRLDCGRPLLLDGGLGSELERRGYDIDSALWSARLIESDPAALRAVHRAYLDAGADCITTASYQASLPGLSALGKTAEEIDACFRKSVELAREACLDFCRARDGLDAPPLVAASVGPYGAYLADGSEYRGNYGLDSAGLERFHAPRLDLLDRAGADLIACETMPDLDELRVLKNLLGRVETPAWVSFCCGDEQNLRDGNPVEAAAELFAEGAQPFALGVNCCAPSLVLPLVERIRAVVPDKPIIVYPNSGQQYDAETINRRDDAALEEWLRLAANWYRAGAAIIGGCCRLGPEYIRARAAKESWPC